MTFKDQTREFRTWREKVITPIRNPRTVVIHLWNATITFSTMMSSRWLVDCELEMSVNATRVLMRFLERTFASSTEPGTAGQLLDFTNVILSR